MICLVFRSKKRNEHSIERIFEPLSEALTEQGTKNERVYVPEDRYNTFIKVFHNIMHVKRVKADIYHITGEIYYISTFLPKKKTIITIHDLASINNNLDLTKTKYKLLRYIMFYFPIKHSSVVTCISEKTRDEIIDIFPWSKKKLVVIPNLIEPNYIYSDYEFCTDCPTILLVGTRSNKNIERVIKAVKGIKCRLHIIGKLNREQLDLLNDENVQYINEFDLNDGDMYFRYQKSDLVCFASTYEGFGMPVIEAQAVGRPVVTSNIRPLCDICGEGAVLVNPYDVVDIGRGIKSVISNGELRKRLISEGKKNVEKFRIDIITSEYKKLYDGIMEGHERKKEKK